LVEGAAIEETGSHAQRLNYGTEPYIIKGLTIWTNVTGRLPALQGDQITKIEAVISQNNTPQSI
jgi:hypothetical protein